MPSAKVIGVAGYSGSELARLLISHPKIDNLQLIDRKAEKPTPISQYRPNLRGTTDQLVVGKDDGSQADVVFFATPDGVTMELARTYLDRGIRVVDFSGDTRLRCQEVHQATYGITHKDPDLLKEAVYGLPELNRDKIGGARVVANPGCYATCVTLGLAPAIKGKVVSPTSLIADCKSGVSGAGKHITQRMHFAECEANFNAYKVTGHKHISEIEQELSLLGQQEIRISFVPHLLPITRGILTTIYGDLVGNDSLAAIQSLYEDFYATAPFVRVLPQGEECSLKGVQGSNFLDISLHLDQRNSRLIITSVEDNLIKGAAGQAVQNMNLMLGLDETLGLMQPGLWL
jgi:N-acetyl-gamma-glutamyl-phosphate reductase